MNSDNFEKYREEIYKFIKEEIVPKYPEIESCTMHILPKEFINTDVEYIFKIKSNLNIIDLNNLKRNILIDIRSSFGKDSTRKILIILSEF